MHTHEYTHKHKAPWGTDQQAPSADTVVIVTRPESDLLWDRSQLALCVVLLHHFLFLSRAPTLWRSFCPRLIFDTLLISRNHT